MLGYTCSHSTEINVDYLPFNDSYTKQLNKTLPMEAYTMQLCDSFWMLSDSSHYHPDASFGLPRDVIPERQAVLTADLPAAVDAKAGSYQALPFDQAIVTYLDQGRADVVHEAVPNTSFGASCVSQPMRAPMSSRCGDRLQTACVQSPEVWLHYSERESSLLGLSKIEPKLEHPNGKKGRPQLNRKSDSASAGYPNTDRMPHNKVERRYREGLNAGFERLRRAVPMLLQSNNGSVMGQPKPSKAMVIAGAINYIEKMEQEGRVLQDENDRLRARL
ncbi:hypothetical protein C7974DRAFT_219264 [Boeremia exigua]|uniref:uncharacterized protein n=1 Tax=Boeremia exigua TaxID=749465 RepID=UPI001E8ECB9B|nr:uncharacterized protein C7974DRAFT_219264 [Boeremia exigua]KAH6622265.1 hypothetical protein C7974DRAFT_219264 [Boeremia exigua]